MNRSDGKLAWRIYDTRRGSCSCIGSRKPPILVEGKLRSIDRFFLSSVKFWKKVGESQGKIWWIMIVCAWSRWKCTGPVCNVKNLNDYDRRNSAKQWRKSRSGKYRDIQFRFTNWLFHLRSKFSRGFSVSLGFILFCCY